MKNRRILSVLLTGVMVMGMSANVFAIDTDTTTVGTGTKENPAAVSITKELELAEGLAVPDATFTFTAVSKTPDAPTATISPIVYSPADNKGNLENGKYTISKDSAISFGTFTHAGLYEYTVTETQGSDTGITYSTASYKLRVYVANADDGNVYVKTITASDTENTKKEKILFTNTYVKNNQTLEIEKKTVGELADKTKDFEFKITIIKSATETTDNPNYTGKIGEETVNVPAGTETSFKLHDGEKLVFNNLPAGTRYIVTEVGVQDGYTPSVQVTENGTQSDIREGNDADSLSTAENSTNLVGENTNKVEFTNKYEVVPITGLILNNLPFIMLAGVAVLAFGILAILKRKRNVNL